MVKVKIICDEPSELIYLNERYYELEDNSVILNVPEDSISDYEFIGEAGGFKVERLEPVKEKKPVKKGRK